jgi:hypothetical protein
MLAQLADLPKEAEEEARTIAELQQQLRETAAKLRRAEKSGTVVERIDERAVTRAVQDAERRLGATINHLRKALEAAVKFIINVSTQNFDAAGVDREELERAITAAVGKATQLIDQRLESRAKQIDQLRLQAQRIAGQLKAALGDEETVVSVDVAKNAPFTVTAPPAQRPVRTASIEPAAGVSRPQQRMLNALANLEALGLTPAPRNQIAALSDQSPRSSGFEKNMSTLRSSGYIRYPNSDSMELTDEGRQIAQADAGGTTLAEIHAGWREIVSGPQWRMCQALIGVYPDAMERAALAAESSQSVTSSGFEKNLSTLRTLGLIAYPSSSEAVATELLMPKGLR